MGTTSNQDIHGHEVMRMMLELGAAFDVESLEAAIHARLANPPGFARAPPVE